MTVVKYDKQGLLDRLEAKRAEIIRTAEEQDAANRARFPEWKAKKIREAETAVAQAQLAQSRLTLLEFGDEECSGYSNCPVPINPAPRLENIDRALRELSLVAEAVVPLKPSEGILKLI